MDIDLFQSTSHLVVFLVLLAVMKNTVIVTPQIVDHIAKLANIPVTQEEKKTLSDGFTKTMEVVDHLSELNTSSIEPTHQVTGLVNVLRDDVVDQARMFTQKQALSNAKKTHNGFFVVEQILEEK